MNLPVDEAPPAAMPEWMLTYGDLMSLLLTFFIMLYSMTELKTDGRVVQAVEAMQRQFGKEPADEAADDGRRGARTKTPLGTFASSRNTGPSRTAAIGGSMLFSETSAELSATEREHLSALVERLQGKSQRIEIRGHTTRRPTAEADGFDDHWQLAFARCREVERFLTAAGIDSRRLRLSVAGGNEPAYIGDDPLGKRENSRVDVFLLDEFAGLNDDGASPVDATKSAR